MTDDEYLENILKNQRLEDDSQELKDLQTHREKVQGILEEEFADSDPTIKYAGSRAKNTFIKEAYDIDVACYLPPEDADEEGPLKDIFERAERALQKEYVTERKRSAIRLLTTADKKRVHVDVVPGRFCDGTKGDAFLHVTDGTKDRLKTNLRVHINHVKGSGRTEEIRLLKLWKARENLDASGLKTFVLELIAIDILKGRKKGNLAENLKAFWTHVQDNWKDLMGEDPANPEGNDLSNLLNDGVKAALRDTAARTLRNLEASGWEAVFGPAEPADKAAKASMLRSTAAAVAAPIRPWCDLK